MRRATDQANVLRLYEELSVSPEDGVDRLTERYRQRIRQLHPDAERAASAEASPGNPDGIGWLSRSYREAIAFERIHGRLPGAGLEAASPHAPAPDLATGYAPSTFASTVAEQSGNGSRLGRFRKRDRDTSGNGWRWAIAIITVIAVILATLPGLLDISPPNPFREPTGAPTVPKPIRPQAADAAWLQ